MTTLEITETQIPQRNPENLGATYLPIDEGDQLSFAASEADPSNNVFERATHLGHNALLNLRDRIAFPRRLGRILVTGLATVSGVGMTATSDASANTHLLNPTNTIVPIKSYYGTMLGQSATSPFRISRVELSAHSLLQAGSCVYDSNGTLYSPVKSTLDTPRGEDDTYCASKPGRHTTQMFTPRAKFISNPSMNFQPMLTQQGDKAALSAGAPATSHGLTTRMSIFLNNKKHRSEADVFYGRGTPPTSGKQLKELKFITHNLRETVRKLWY